MGDQAQVKSFMKVGKKVGAFASSCRHGQYLGLSGPWLDACWGRITHLEDIALKGKRIESGTNIVWCRGRVHVGQEVIVCHVAVLPGRHGGDIVLAVEMQRYVV